MSEPTAVEVESSTIGTSGASLGFAMIVALTTFIALLAMQWLPLFVLLCIAASVAIVLWRWPDLTTIIVVGLIYTNLPVVAVQFHGLPGIFPAMVLGLLGWPLFYRLALKAENFCLSSSVPWLVCFAAVQVIGALLSKYQQLTFDKFMSFFLEGFVLYFAITNLVRTRRMLKSLFWTLAVCAILMGGVPLLQQLTKSYETDYWGLSQMDSLFAAGENAIEGTIRQPRFAGTIGEKNRYAQFMIILVPFGLALIAVERSRRRKILAGLATMLAFIGFALAFSRGAAIGLAIALIVAGFMRIFSRGQLKIVAVAAILICLLLPQYLGRLSSLGPLFGIAAKGNTQLDQADGAVRGRLTEMGAAVMVFRDHPIVGVGPGAFGEYSQAYGQIIGLRSLEAGRQSHSMPLDIAAEHGILGLIALGGLLLVISGRLLNAKRCSLLRKDHEGEQLAVGLLLALMLYLGTALFLHLSYIRYFWLLIALADSGARILNSDDLGSDYLPKANS